MYRELSPPRSFRSRARGLALAGSAFFVLLMCCLQFAAMTRSAWRSVLAAGPADPDQMLVALCGSLALALTLWMVGALAISLVAALGRNTSAVGRAASRCARLIAPMVLRNMVAALLGVVIVASPAAAQATLPTGSRHQPPVAAASFMQSPDKGGPGPQAQGLAQQAQPAVRAEQELSPSWLPSATDVAASAPGARAAHPSTVRLPPARQADPTLLPGWLPERPAQVRPARAPVIDLGPAATARRRPQAHQDDEIVVRQGDTLWDIAARHLGNRATFGEIAMEWPHWFTTNQAVIGSDPDHLIPGERLRAPSHQGGAHRARALHVVRDGSAR